MFGDRPANPPIPSSQGPNCRKPRNGIRGRARACGIRLEIHGPSVTGADELYDCPLSLSATVFVLVCRNHVWNQISIMTQMFPATPDLVFLDLIRLSFYSYQLYGESDHLNSLGRRKLLFLRPGPEQRSYLDDRHRLINSAIGMTYRVLKPPMPKSPRSSGTPPLENYDVERVYAHCYRRPHQAHHKVVRLRRP